MAKIDSSLILKPGAVLKVEKIDFNDPAVKAIIEESQRQQRLMLKMYRFSQKAHDSLSRVITI